MDIFAEFMVVAKELLRVTLLVKLTGDADNLEQEMGNYNHLLEKREPMIQKMSALLKKLEGQNLTEEQRQEAKSLLAQIAEADQQLMEDARMFMVSVKGQVQGIESNKRRNAGYAHPMEQFSQTGSGFDTSQ
jgi:hypothetical protein